MVPPAMTEGLYRAAAKVEFKDIYKIGGAGHNGAWKVGGEGYLNALDSFIKKCS
jgi:hypothetical protein